MKTVVSAVTGGLLGLVAAFVLDVFLTPAPDFSTNSIHWYERARLPLMLALIVLGIVVGIVRSKQRGLQSE